MFPSQKDEEVAKVLNPFFEEVGGFRVLGKIRLDLDESTRTFTMKAWIGSHDGPVIDLCDRAQKHADPAVAQVLAVIEPFTDEEVAQALSCQFLWKAPAYAFDRSGAKVSWEYSAGNRNFAAESIQSIAGLVAS